MIERHRHTGLTGDGEKIDIRNLKGTTESLSASKTFTITTSDSIGLKDYVGFGFQPGRCHVRARYIRGTPGYAVYSEGWVHRGDSIPDTDFSYPDSGGIQYINSTTSLVKCVDESGNQTIANFIKFLPDGIQLFITDKDFDIEFIVTAYK